MLTFCIWSSPSNSDSNQHVALYNLLRCLQIQKRPLLSFCCFIADVLCLSNCKFAQKQTRNCHVLLLLALTWNHTDTRFLNWLFSLSPWLRRLAHLQGWPLVFAHEQPLQSADAPIRLLLRPRPSKTYDGLVCCSCRRRWCYDVVVVVVVLLLLLLFCRCCFLRRNWHWTNQDMCASTLQADITWAARWTGEFEHSIAFV